MEHLKKDILSALDKTDFLIIKSTPGSGKTTRVPVYLAEKYQKKIYVLEPRKLAAKLASHYVAQKKGEKPGESVGHIFKYEKVSSDKTQIIFLTEGTFLRILATDPNLSDCDAVILDEFHERHYYTDVALSYLLKVKETNKNLKVIIMSATINLKELDDLLKHKSLTIEFNQTKHNLLIEHLPNDTLVLKEPLERKVYNALVQSTDREGHILVFLPGMYEINVCEEIARKNFSHEIIVLHGEIAGVTIDESFYDLKKKKIILSTNVAESSVTIPGVRTVIDSGLHKTNKLNPITRLPLIELKKISQSSAIQRANRAGREADGKVYRLYSEMDYQMRDRFDTPEINRVDLERALLSSAGLFKAKIEDFIFLSPLNPSEVDKSKKYLEQVGLFSDGFPTDLARKLSKTPFHPRIAKVLDEVSKKDEPTFNEVVNYLANLIEPKGAFRFKSLVKNFFSPNKTGKADDLEKMMLFGYVDQIAKLKDHKLIHLNGEVYSLSPKITGEIDPSHDLWIILELDNRNQVTRLLPIEEDWLFDLPFFPVEETEKVDFDLDTFKLSVERLTKVGAIVLSKEKLPTGQITDQTIEYVAKKLMPVFEEKLAEDTFKRLLFLERLTALKISDFPFSRWFKEQISYLLADRTYNLEVILNSYVNEIFSYLNTEGKYDLETDLPLFLQLHDKRKVNIHYDVSNGVHCESYIQDFFGLTTVPTILNGKEKIKIHLLGPHKRALQVTQDLMSFWDRTYKELYVELKRDYPRHYWPLSPKEAKPILLQKNVK